jgi:ParB family chromosome partitioning protein
LLKLPNEIQVAVRDNLISMGHARALINVENEQAQLVILKNILERKASVRQVEEMVRNIAIEKTLPLPPQPHAVDLPEKFEQARSFLRNNLNSGVEVKVNRKGAGKIIITFKSDEDFKRIMAKFES